MINRFTFSNAALASWFLADGILCFRVVYIVGAEPMEVSWGITMLCLVLFVATRKPPVSVDDRLSTRIIVFIGTFLPTFYFWLPTSEDISSYSILLRSMGMIGIVSSILYLNTNFSLLPQLRRIVRKGPYEIVRHPMYTSYLVLDLTLWLPDESLLGGVVWIGEAAFLYWRANLEETILKMNSDDYESYCLRVSYRFVPGIV